MENQPSKINMVASLIEGLVVNIPFKVQDENPTQMREISMTNDTNFSIFDKVAGVYKVTMTINISQTEIPDFKISLRLTGLFLIEKEIDRNQIEKLLTVDATQAVYGSAREIISSIIRNSSHLPIILPMIDFPKAKLDKMLTSKD